MNLTPRFSGGRGSVFAMEGVAWAWIEDRGMGFSTLFALCKFHTVSHFVHQVVFFSLPFQVRSLYFVSHTVHLIFPISFHFKSS